MEVILEIQKGKQSTVLKMIDKNRKKFPKIQKLIKYDDDDSGIPRHIMVIYDDKYTLDYNKREQLKKKYLNLTNVLDATVIQITRMNKKNISKKRCHFIFDVDSTLTSGKHTIRDKIRSIFTKISDQGHRVYLASGRHETQLRKDMGYLNTERFGIAENGGIILGMGTDDHLVLGNRTEPDKVLLYMKMHCKKITEDMPQGFRITEVIFNAKITQSKFLNYVKKSKANVSVLSSKNSYHVAKKNINKGYALERLRHELKFGDNDIVIGVGDSDLDIPMFKESDHAFAVGNASLNAKKHAENLERSHADGIEEMYTRLFV